MRKAMIAATIASIAAPMMPATAAPSAYGRSSPGYTMRAAAMRAGPDRDYPSVRIIPRNRKVDVFGCLNDWSWCDVGYRHDRGWVAANLLSADYRGRRQRFDSVAPYIGIGVLAFMFGSYWDNHYRSRQFYSERGRWERHYNDAYKPQWGPRPSRPPIVREPDRRKIEQRPRTEQNRRDLNQNKRIGSPPSGTPPVKLNQRPLAVPKAGPATSRSDAVSGPKQGREVRKSSSDRRPTVAKPGRASSDDNQHNVTSRH